MAISAKREKLRKADEYPVAIAFTGIERRLAETYIQLVRRSTKYSAVVLATSQGEIKNMVENQEG